MAYYVLGSGGSKSGPVDVARLNEWVGSGTVTPETLIEDASSGVKSPARAVRGLNFPGIAFAPKTDVVDRVGQPLSTVALTPLSPQSPPLPALSSNYMRPGAGTGGSQPNLFLPGVDSKWAWQGIACVVGAVACGAIVGFTHYYFGKLVLFAFALPIFGIQRGRNGIRANRPLAVVVIALNVLAFLAVVAFLLRNVLF
ncbi:MAG: hypothetical protein ACYC96_13815 [Fimbriimonadaceae bacterium]